MTRKVFKVRIDLFVLASTTSEACDGISEMLRRGNFVLDWGYLQDERGTHVIPKETEVDPETYEEGDYDKLPKVEAHAIRSWGWECPECGRRNDIDGDARQWTTAAETCAYCGNRYIISSPWDTA